MQSTKFRKCEILQNRCPTSLKNKQFDKREGEESLEIAVGEKETQVCITQLQRTELV